MKTVRGRRIERGTFTRRLADTAHASEALLRNPAIPDNPALTRLFSLREVAQKAALPPRGVQFWVEHGLLRCVAPDAHTGRGVHRLFHPVEIQVAALLGPLAAMPVNELQKFAAVFRACLLSEPLAAADMPVELAVDDWREISRVLFRGARGEGVNFLVIPFFPVRPSVIATVTDEAGPPVLNLARIYPTDHLPRISPTDLAIGTGMTIVIEATTRLAPLFA
jgi:hypothetical protein